MQSDWTDNKTALRRREIVHGNKKFSSFFFCYSHFYRMLMKNYFMHNAAARTTARKKTAVHVKIAFYAGESTPKSVKSFNSILVISSFVSNVV